MLDGSVRLKLVVNGVDDVKDVEADAVSADDDEKQYSFH